MTCGLSPAVRTWRSGGNSLGGTLSCRARVSAEIDAGSPILAPIRHPMPVSRRNRSTWNSSVEIARFRAASRSRSGQEVARPSILEIERHGLAPVRS